MKRLFVVCLGLMLFSVPVWAQRSKKPPTFTDLKDTNQLSELNTTLSDFWNIMNGRYTLDHIVVNPNAVRKGIKGDMCYATFLGADHFCVATSFPIGTTWTCIDVGTLGSCPAGADGQIMFNDNATCGSDIDFQWEKNVNVETISGDINFASYIVSGITTVSTNIGSGERVIKVTDQTVSDRYGVDLTLISGKGSTDVDGRDGGDLNLLSADAATGTNKDAGHIFMTAGSSTSGFAGNVTIKAGSSVSSTIDNEGGDILIKGGAASTSGTSDGGGVKVLTGTPGNGNGGDFEVFAANGGATGQGGGIDIQAGSSRGALSSGGDASVVSGGPACSATIASIPGQVYIRSASGTCSAPGDTGNINLITGNTDATGNNGTAGNILLNTGISLGTNKNGGSVALTLNGPTGSGTGGAFTLSRNTVTGITVENVLSKFNNAVIGIADGTTITNERAYQFLASTLNGVSGGGTETVTSGITVYIDGAPSGSNITITNPYALMVANGATALAGGSAGKAMCWKADGMTLGYCSSTVGAGGACTCN